MKRFPRLALSTFAILLASCGGGNDVATSSQREAPQAVAKTRASVLSQAALSAPASAVIDARLQKAKGPVDIWVSLADPSVVEYRMARLDAASATKVYTARASRLQTTAATKSELRAHRDALRATQASMMSQLAGYGAKSLGNVVISHNGMAVRVDASSIAAIAKISGVTKVRPVVNYTLDTSEVVSYVGAAAAQALGKDGTGVRVAVLDSGIDYTHYNLGGAGTLEAYAAAYGAAPGDPKNISLDGLFPTAKVVGGYDFVGEAWPTFGERTEDPDPIDYQGHGTHVADIIAGRSADGKHVGIAPGAKLYAVKVCSAVATSCNGVALVKGIDFALDPNGDGSLSDAVDVVNMSLGSAYGQQEDDLTEASSQAVRYGVVVVAAAGNNGNLPFVVSSPSIAPGVISVAQTAVPSDKAFPLLVTAPASIAGSYGNTATMDFAPIGNGASGDVVFVGTACPGTTLINPPAGKIALINRGTCSVSLKIDAVAKAGAKGALIGLIAPGDAVSFSFGGGDTFVPSLVIQQSLSQAIQSNLNAGKTVTVSISSANAVSLKGSIVSSSARGPSVNLQSIKPEIGAPGASISAEVGTGNGETAFGGTSGATPVISGAAAILIQAFPDRTPEQIKAMLQNSAYTTIYDNPALNPGKLAPITRIGAGEVRIAAALKLTGDARDVRGKSATLSYGFPSVTGKATITKQLLVENFSAVSKTYSVKPSFRYANDAASGAVLVKAPTTVTVPPGGTATIDVSLAINADKLPDWGLNGGSLGGSGSLLEGYEFDGYVTLKAGAETLSVPWQVLPRKSSLFGVLPVGGYNAGAPITLKNGGAGYDYADAFALTGTSPKVDPSLLPKPGDNYTVTDLRAVGVRLVEPGTLQFAINTYGRRATPNYPAGFEIDIDVDGDGVADYFVNSNEASGFGLTGQSLVYVTSIATGVSNAYYYNIADLYSGNVIYTVPTAALGITDDTKITFTVLGYDNYFTGNVTDVISGMTYTPSKPKFVLTGGVDGTYLEFPPRSSQTFSGTAVPANASASPSQTGLLLMYGLDSGREAEIIPLK